MPNLGAPHGGRSVKDMQGGAGALPRATDAMLPPAPEPAPEPPAAEPAPWLPVDEPANRTVQQPVVVEDVVQSTPVTTKKRWWRWKD